MRLYYDIVDPIVMIITILLCIGGILFATIGEANKTSSSATMAIICGWIIAINILFMIYNLDWSITKKNKHQNNQYNRHTRYNALYDYGERNRNNDSWSMSTGLFFYALFSLMASFITMGMGIYLILLAESDRVKSNDSSHIETIPEEDKIPRKIKIYYYVTGGFAILSSIVAISRMPIDYLFTSLGLLWLISIWSSTTYIHISRH